MLKQAALHRRLKLFLLAILLLTSAACRAVAVEGNIWNADNTIGQAGVPRGRASAFPGRANVSENGEPDTILIAMPRPFSLRTTIIRWAAWIVLLTAIGLALIGLLFLRGRRRLWGAGLLGLFLITFVPPFSYVPDPLGLVLAASGGYRYDPRLPLVNRFLVAGDPTQALRPSLDPLVGRTGREPLDPVSPLDHYEFLSVRTYGARSPSSSVHVRFIYEDGSRRTYAVPVARPETVSEFYACCWQYEGPIRPTPDIRPEPWR